MTQPQSVPADPARMLKAYLDSPTVHEKLGKVLPKHISSHRLVQQCLSLCYRMPTLMECSHVSIALGVIQAAELGLELSGPLGQAYLVPRWNKQKKCREATFQVGYRGWIDLAYRSGTVTSFPLRIVRARDKFSIRYGSYPILEHEPCLDGDPGVAFGYYALVNFRGGGYDFEFMSYAEATAHRDRFRSSESGPWDTDFDQMALKTVARRLCKRLPTSVDAQRAAVVDDTEFHEDSPSVRVLPQASPSRADLIADRLMDGFVETAEPAEPNTTSENDT